MNLDLKNEQIKTFFSSSRSSFHIFPTFDPTAPRMLLGFTPEATISFSTSSLASALFSLEKIKNAVAGFLGWTGGAVDCDIGLKVQKQEKKQGKKF
jgi:hypothetical protein